MNVDLFKSKKGKEIASLFNEGKYFNFVQFVASPDFYAGKKNKHELFCFYLIISSELDKLYIIKIKLEHRKKDYLKQLVGYSKEFGINETFEICRVFDKFSSIKEKIPFWISETIGNKK